MNTKPEPHQASTYAKNSPFTGLALFLFLVLSPYAFSLLHVPEHLEKAVTIAGVILIAYLGIVLGNFSEMRRARLHAMDDVGAEDSAQSHERFEVDRLPQNPSSAEDSMARS
ncbi:hypothetical protein [Kocuria massiliensis]|uniref:hypothetical protein n=1 Tax=Kocuria massiliensis TaxID=1926282 RepID=UPI001179C1C8|nr:hypothetical protein [Kocuria massiliensis]